MTRIEINGEWYIKESSLQETTNNTKQIDFEDVTMSENCIYEDELICLEAIRIKKSDNTFYKDISIDFTDKRINGKENWKNEYIDNCSWFQAIHENDEEAIEEALEFMNLQMLNTLKQFIKYLQKINWLDF